MGQRSNGIMVWVQIPRDLNHHRVPKCEQDLGEQDLGDQFDDRYTFVWGIQGYLPHHPG